MKFKVFTLWKAYKIVLFICLLQSFRAWFFWSFNDVFVNLFLFFLSFLVFLIHSKWFILIRKNLIWFFLLFLASISTSTHSNFFGILDSIIRILPLYFIITLKSELKHDLHHTIRKWFSVLLFISIIGWILFLLGVNMPNSTIYYGEFENSFQYSYSNYYMFLKNNTISIKDYFRFSSVFLEPGYLGCLLSVFLYLSRYKLDKINIVFLVSLFFTFSLAGYVITIIGYLLFSLKAKKRKFLWLVVTILLYFATINIAQDYNNGDNWFNNAIVERLQPDVNKGISGYNRSTEDTDLWFWNTFINREDFFFGTGEFIDKNDVDWKTYIYVFGLIPFLLYVFYLFYPLMATKNNKYEILVLVLLYLLIFAQTIHGNFWLFYLALFVIGIDIKDKYIYVDKSSISHNKIKYVII